jgi:hypothetical protein
MNPVLLSITNNLSVMKNLIIIFLISCSICAISGCAGNNTSKNQKDTIINTYKTPKDTSKMDTSKVNSADNTATGGAGNTVDTVKPGKKHQ